MKPKILTILLLTGVFNYAVAQNYTIKNTNISINGNSTMHKWSSSVKKSVFNGAIDMENGVVKDIKSATLKVTVKDIKSDKDSDMMDTRTYKALKYEKYPTILYTFTNAKSITRKGNDFEAVVDGKLQISGVSKNTTMKLVLTPLAGGDLRIVGSDKVLFTNHGLKPPSFVAGTLKVDNEVTVSFNLVVKK